jgi:Wax ester synthase-like Acyl-CoA acyltransferase domain
VLDPLRYRLVEIPWRMHHPMWLQDCDIDLDYHLRRVQITPSGGRRELDELIGEIMSTPLDRSRPLWEFHFVEGMPDHRFALIAKMHHTLADGVASANLVARLMDPTVTAGDSDESVRAAPSKSRLLAIAARDHVHQIAALPALIGQTIRGATGCYTTVQALRVYSAVKMESHIDPMSELGMAAIRRRCAYFLRWSRPRSQRSNGGNPGCRSSRRRASRQTTSRPRGQLFEVQRQMAMMPPQPRQRYGVISALLSAPAVMTAHGRCDAE